MLTLNDLLALFKRDIHGKLLDALEQPGVRGLSVYENKEGRRRAVPAKVGQEEFAGDGYALVGTFWKPELLTSGSRTQDALAWLAQDPKHSVKKASKMFHVSRQTIMKARDARIGKVICPCCNQVVREGFTINREVLK